MGTASYIEWQNIHSREYNVSKTLQHLNKRRHIYNSFPGRSPLSNHVLSPAVQNTPRASSILYQGPDTMYLNISSPDHCYLRLHHALCLQKFGRRHMKNASLAGSPCTCGMPFWPHKTGTTFESNIFKNTLKHSLKKKSFLSTFHSCFTNNFTWTWALHSTESFLSFQIWIWFSTIATVFFIMLCMHVCPFLFAYLLFLSIFCIMQL